MTTFIFLASDEKGDQGLFITNHSCIVFQGPLHDQNNLVCGFLMQAEH